jgi:predicted aspartyl protease
MPFNHLVKEMKLHRPCASLFLVLFSMILLNAARAENAATQCRYTNFATFPIKPASRMLTIDGSMNGNAAAMMIDTGSQRTQITRRAAEKLGLALSHSNTYSIGVGGESASYTTRIDDFSFGKLDWHGVHLGVLWDIDKSLNYSALVGADILFHQDVEISMANRQIKFFEPNACDQSFLAYWDENASSTPMHAIAPDDLRQVVTVQINGKEVRALMDSGASTSIIDLAAAARAGITPESPGVVALGSGSGVGKHRAQMWQAQFQSFAIGEETISSPKICIMDIYGAARSDSNHVAATDTMLHDQPEMVLGADFVRSHRLLFALSQKRLYFSYLGGQVFGASNKAKVSEEAKL